MVTAWLQRHIGGSTTRLVTGHTQRMHLGMRLARALVIAFTDNLTVTHNHTAHIRIRCRRKTAMARQLQRPRHILHIIHCFNFPCGLSLSTQTLSGATAYQTATNCLQFGTISAEIQSLASRVTAFSTSDFVRRSERQKKNRRKAGFCMRVIFHRTDIITSRRTLSIDIRMLRNQALALRTEGRYLHIERLNFLLDSVVLLLQQLARLGFIRRRRCRAF